MQLESRAETDAEADVNAAVVHEAAAEVSGPRVVSSVLRRRPTPVGKPFVFIITLRNS